MYKLLAKKNKGGSYEWVNFIQRLNGDKDIVLRGVIKTFGDDHLKPHQMAIEHCFFARVDGEKGQSQFDEREAAGGARAVWLTLDEAQKKYAAHVPGFSKHRFRILFGALPSLAGEGVLG